MHIHGRQLSNETPDKRRISKHHFEHRQIGKIKTCNEMESIPGITSFGPATERINIQKLQANEITGNKMNEEKSFSQ